MFTIPNVVSLVRLALVPLFLWLLVSKDDVAAAGWTLFVIGSTDWVDGFLARKLNQVSELGKLLDPLADRLAVAAAVLAGWATDVLPTWLALPLIVREVLVAITALYLLTRGVSRIDVRPIGKWATAFVYGGITWMFWGVGYDVEWIRVFAGTLGAIGLVLYYYVLIPYAQDVRAKLAAQQSRS